MIYIIAINQSHSTKCKKRLKSKLLWFTDVVKNLDEFPSESPVAGEIKHHGFTLLSWRRTLGSHGIASNSNKELQIPEKKHSSIRIILKTAQFSDYFFNSQKMTVGSWMKPCSGYM